MARKPMTLTEAVNKVLDAKKPGTLFTKKAFISSVEKKLRKTNDCFADSAMRVMRKTGKVAYSTELGRYVVYNMPLSSTMKRVVQH